jgi:hypothetical protein
VCIFVSLTFVEGTPAVCSDDEVGVVYDPAGGRVAVVHDVGVALPGSVAEEGAELGDTDGWESLMAVGEAVATGGSDCVGGTAVRGMARGHCEAPGVEVPSRAEVLNGDEVEDL